ncbi:MAG: hypothetical protein ACRDHP_11320, partial [Ktedonobacterales bacterium]
MGIATRMYRVADAQEVHAERSGRRVAVIETVLIVAALLAELLLLPHEVKWDGSVRFAELSQLLGTGTIPGSKYSLIGPLFSSPLWLLGTIGGHSKSLVARYNWIVFSLGLAAIYGL